MLLAIDVGNTNIALALFLGQEIVANWRVRTEARRTADEYWVLLSGLLDRRGLRLPDIDAVCASSVVPGVIDPLRRFSARYLGIEDPLIVSAAADTGIEIRYVPASDVGADRLANAAAALEIYQAAAVIVDFGTATTVDAVTSSGEYLGGAIAPGIEVASEALFRTAAQLRRVELVAPPTAIGTTTAQSLQSGIIYGFAGHVDALVERFRAEMDEEPKVIATGGLADLIAPHSHTIQDVNPVLTLHGLRIIYERSSERRPNLGSRG